MDLLMQIEQTLLLFIAASIIVLAVGGKAPGSESKRVVIGRASLVVVVSTIAFFICVLIEIWA